MPRGKYKRQPIGRRAKPEAAPPMPPKPGGGRWRESTRRAWSSWFTSGRAGLLDDAGVQALVRLCSLHDRGEGEGWPREISREVRLLEAHLLAKVAPDAMARGQLDARRLSPEELREWTRKRTAAALDGLDHHRWPARTSAEPAHTTAGRYELAALDESALTTEQRREADRFHHKLDAFGPWDRERFEAMRGEADDG